MCKDCGKKPCICDAYPNDKMHEHDTVTSRTTGRKVEIGMTPGHMVSKNPFASVAQQHFLEAHPEKLKGKIHEWEKSTDYAHLPKKVKKGK